MGTYICIATCILDVNVALEFRARLPYLTTDKNHSEVNLVAYPHVLIVLSSVSIRKFIFYVAPFRMFSLLTWNLSISQWIYLLVCLFFQPNKNYLSLFSRSFSTAQTIYTLFLKLYFKNIISGHMTICIQRLSAYLWFIWIFCSQT